MRHRALRERGFALLIVLWSLVLLTLLFTQLTSVGRGEARIADNLRANAAAEAAISGVVQEAIFHLLDSEAAHWDADGVVHEWRIPSGTARARITDDAGLINPNSASAALLRALLHAVGADAATASEVANGIIGWRTPDAQTAVGPDAYMRAGMTYRPPQAPFQSVEELGLVLGMTPTLLERLRPHLSIYNADAVNPLLADAIVGEALREEDGPPRRQQSTSPMPRNVAITAVVVTLSATISRRAEVRLNSPKDGPPFMILSWEPPRNVATN